MTYEEAVAYVMQEKAAAYTFIPKMRGGKAVGGGAYVIAYDEGHETEPDEWFEYNVHYGGGLFRSSSGEEEIYGPDDVPDEARSASYLPTDHSAVSALDFVTEMMLLCLKGFSQEEAGYMMDRMTSDQMIQCVPKPS